MTLTVGSLFAGIGGFDLGFERAGFEIRWQVEIDPFCRAVLAKHWPNVRRYEDVRTVGAELERVDVLCGGFPCQDISVAGKGEGIDGARSGLWREFDRLIGELRPRYVIVENVAALLVRGLGRVLGDLAACGYDAEWDCIPASAVGAPHQRDRIWLVAYPSDALRRPVCGIVGRSPSACASEVSIGPLRQKLWPSDDDRPTASREDVADTALDGWRSRRSRDASEVSRRRQLGRGCLSANDVGDTDGARQLQPQGRIFDERRRISNAGWWDVEPNVGRVAHGIPARVDRLRGLGNAIVPQIAQWIAERIQEAEGLTPRPGGPR